jgi:hypothetical protein
MALLLYLAPLAGVALAALIFLTCAMYVSDASDLRARDVGRQLPRC